jgi:multiple sugar transport system substrate-binding protein
MKPRKSVTVSAALLALATTGLAACTSNSSTTDSSGRTPILIYDINNAKNTPVFEQLIDKFNTSQTTYTVKHQIVPGGGAKITAAVLNAIKTGQAPNGVFADSDPASLGQIVQTGKVVPLDDVLATGPTPVAKTDFPPAMLDASTFNGKLYSMPVEGGDYAVMYNKQMFAAAGITSTPTTWTELATDAQKLTTNGTYGMYLPLGEGEWPVFAWQAMLQSAGGTLLTDNNTKAAFNSPAGVTALEAWSDMIANKTAYPNSLADSAQDQGEPGFDAKKIAMFIAEVYNIKSASAALGASNIGVFPLPAVGPKPGMVVGTNVSFVLQGSPAQQAGTWAFLSWLQQPAQQAPWAATTGYLPTNNQSLTQPAWTNYTAQNPLVSVFADELEYAVTRPSISSYAEVSAALNTAINTAMTKKQTPQQTLDTAAAKTNAILKTN